MVERQLTTILAVDDLQDNLDLISEIFADESYKVLTAQNADEALRLACKEKPDIAIVDVQMPGVDGYALCTWLRHEPRTQQLPILFLTAQRTTGEDATQGLDLGARDYVVKPVNAEELRARVRAVLRVQDEHNRVEARLQQHAAVLQADIGTLEEAKRVLEDVVAKNDSLIIELRDTYGKLRESEARTRSLLDAPPESSLLIDRSGRVLACNAVAAKGVGLSREEFVGRCIYDVLPAGIAVPRRQRVESAFATARPVRFEEENADRVYDVNIYPVDAEEGDVRACALFTYDITARKQEAAAAAELMRMKSELVAHVSHELRTPICSIKGFLDLLTRGKVADAAVQQDFLNRTAKEANRLAALVNDLLDLSRFEAGRLELDLGAVDMGVLIKETLQAVEGLAGAKSICLTCALPESPLLAKGDHRRLQQVLTNLVGNAIKFSEAHSSVRVCAEQNENLCTVKVIDTGPGIPAEDVAKLFERFYQSDTIQKHRGQGSGLGLYIAKQIIEAHGGQVGVESKLGSGSTFWFCIRTDSDSTAIKGPCQGCDVS